MLPLGTGGRETTKTCQRQAVLLLQNGWVGMTQYRFVFLDATGGIVRSAPLPCQDDLDALERAVNLHDSPHLQVWDGDRIVVRMNNQGDAEPGAIIPRNLNLA